MTRQRPQPELYTSAMRVRLVDVPYDCGVFGARMGKGPSFLIERGLERSLSHAGHEVGPTRFAFRRGFTPSGTHWSPRSIKSPVPSAPPRRLRSARSFCRAPVDPRRWAPSPRWAPARRLCAGLMRTAISTRRRHHRPVSSTGCRWLSRLAPAGRPRAPARRVRACARGAVIQIGVRSTDSGEEERLRRSRVTRLGVHDGDRLSTSLRQIAAGALYLHVDLDVIDEAELERSVHGARRPRGRPTQSG